MTKLNLLYFASDGGNEYNSSAVRASYPGEALLRAGHNVRILHIQHWLRGTDESKFACSSADVISIQRVLVEESIEQALFWKARGKAVVVDWDDNYKGVRASEGNPAIAFWSNAAITINTPYGSYESKLDKHPITQFHDGLGRITAGTVPSRVICDDYKEIVRMFYLPNYLPSHRFIRAIKKKNDDIVIGYGMSMGHLQSVKRSGINDALARLTTNRGSVRVMIIGDKRIADLLPVSKSKLLYRPYVAYYDWPETLAQFDISLAPLYGEFDMRRSFLKTLEAGLMTIPLVGTYDPLYPVYEEFKDVPSMRFVPSELTVPDYDERVELWYNALLDEVDNIAEYRELARQSREHAMKFDIDANVPNIVRTYEEILNLR